MCLVFCAVDTGFYSLGYWEILKDFSKRDDVTDHLHIILKRP